MTSVEQVCPMLHSIAWPPPRGQKAARVFHSEDLRKRIRKILDRFELGTKGGHQMAATLGRLLSGKLCHALAPEVAPCVRNRLWSLVQNMRERVRSSKANPKSRRAPLWGKLTGRNMQRNETFRNSLEQEVCLSRAERIGKAIQKA